MFRPGRRLTGFVGVFLPLFVALGFWQLNRADQKTQLMARIEAGQSEVRSLRAGTDPLPYQRYSVNGSLDADHLWLLDNRTHQGRVGYEVWAPLRTEHGWYLASLGWVAGTGRRDVLPRIDVPTGPRAWTAVWRPLSRGFVLGDTPLTDDWPQVIQRIEPEAMAERMRAPEPRGLLQLDAGQAGVGPVIWTPSVMTPARHLGYAVQWFAMALALAVMYGYTGWRRRDPEDETRGETPSCRENNE